MSLHHWTLTGLIATASFTCACSVDSPAGGNDFSSTTGAAAANSGANATGTGAVETTHGATTGDSGMMPSSTTGEAPSANTGSDMTTGGSVETTEGAMPTPDGGSTGELTDGGGAGSDAGPATPNSFPSCEGGSTEPCGTMVLPDGTEVKMGPLGAQMQPNVGQGFEIGGEGLSASICGTFVGSFGADPEAGERLLDIEGLDMTLFTVYRPATMPEGETFPIVTWGNGTCAQPEGYGALLRYVASHGFVVVAANNRFVGSGAAQRAGLDFMFAANADPESDFYQKLDTERVAAMGHSQGGMGTIAAASDARVKTAVIFNGGDNAAKPFLAISGDRDLFVTVPPDLSVPVESAPEAAWLWYHMIPGDGDSDGHLTLMQEPNRVTEPTVAWLKYQLSDDAASRDFFVEPACKLCGQDADFEYGSVGLK